MTYVLGLVFGVVVLLAVFLRMRNSGMKETYATWWIVIALCSLMFSSYPRAIGWISSLFGVVVPLNLAFFAAGVVLLLLSLRFSVDLSKSFEDRRRLAEELAIVRADVTALRDELSTLKAAGGTPVDDAKPSSGVEEASALG